MKKSIVFLLSTVLIIGTLTACSQKNSESSDTVSVSTKSTSDEDKKNTDLNDKSDGAVISLVKTGDDTLKSSDGRLECKYKCTINNGKATVRVDYTNLSDEYMISNFKPSVYCGDKEIAETSHGEDFESSMSELKGGDTYTDLFEYDIADSKEIYLVLNVKSEDATQNKSDKTEQNLAQPRDYTSDNSENSKSDFTFQAD